MEEWECIRNPDMLDKSFIVGRVYTTNKDGRLIDEEGRVRLRPHLYYLHYTFSRHHPIQENE
jgi:hypothetical protein